MIVDRKGLTKDVLSTLPGWIGLSFGDPLTKGISFASLMAKGFNQLSEMNKDWWDEYLTNLEAIELIDEQIKSPQYIQFIRQTIQIVAYETREKKREYLLNLATNYHVKLQGTSFDNKMLFLNILDKLSETELLFIISWYDRTLDPPILYYGYEEPIRNKLVGIGLISQKFDKINKAFEKMNEQAEKTIETINTQIESLKSDSTFYRETNFFDVQKFDSSFDKPEVEYGTTQLGLEFVYFIKESSLKRG